MHAEGQSAWFDDGALERNAILVETNYNGKVVLEIGCGEGELLNGIHNLGGNVFGLDYSREAIQTARKRFPQISSRLFRGNYTDHDGKYDIVVMQGVLEHLDNPFAELKAIINRFEPETVVTSSPCFLNTRGIVWMTLNMLGAVMSLTDLHYLNPWQFEDFCAHHHYKLTTNSSDYGWARNTKMINDLKQRIPLALRDGNIDHDPDKLEQFMDWLTRATSHISCNHGAVMIYRIEI